MDFQLSPEQQTLQRTVRTFCAREILPHASRWSRDRIFPRDVISSLASLGMLGIQIPEQFGGAGLGLVDLCVAVEEIAAADASVGLTVASHNLLCMDHIYLAGSNDQRSRFLPRLASGEDLGAWCLTEPDAGSDAGSARTRAERREGPQGVEWVLRGAKNFITQGSVAGVYVILASTTPARKQRGLTAFIVRAGTPGLSVGRHVEKMGLAASDTADLAFDEVVVPDSDRLGDLDRGFQDTGKVLDRGRVGIAAWAIGIGRAAYEASLTYAKDRVQFGQPIANFPAIRLMLAEMVTELSAARLLMWRAAVAQDNGQKTTRESSIAKLYSSKAALKACDIAVQIHGGYGYTKEFPVERYLRDVKLATIGEGTSEIQKLVIAREVLNAARHLAQ